MSEDGHLENFECLNPGRIMLHSNIYYIDLEASICDVKKGKLWAT